jgi:predicted RNA-binding protein with PUA-like domain
MAKQYWLIKSEPGAYSWTKFLSDKKTYWDGVRNYQARNNIRAMKPGDLALFYHSVKEKAVVGIAEVVSEAYPDPTAKGEDWSVVDVKPAFGLKRGVNLAEMKADPRLADMQLIKQSRLSVCPVAKAEFDIITKLGGKQKL